MRLRPCLDQLDDTHVAIRAAVEETLAECDIYEPPTPVDRLLDYRRLQTAEKFEFQRKHVLYGIRRFGKRLWNTVRNRVAGLLDLESRHIAINPALHPRHREFLQFHEIGHELLSWHRELFVVTSEHDLTPDIRERFEADANYFAAQTIFQIDDLAHAYRGKRLRTSDLAAVAARYEASLTATVYQYVQIQDLPTALLMGRPTGPAGSKSIRFRRGVANPAFLREFGRELLGKGFDSEDGATAVLNTPGLTTVETEVDVPDLNGNRRTLTVDTLYNTYSTLSLLHPKRRVRKIFGSWGKSGAGIKTLL